MLIARAVICKQVYIPDVCRRYRDIRHQLCPCALRPNCLLDIVECGGLWDTVWCTVPKHGGVWDLVESFCPSPTDGRLVLWSVPRSSQEWGWSCTPSGDVRIYTVHTQPATQTGVVGVQWLLHITLNCMHSKFLTKPCLRRSWKKIGFLMYKLNKYYEFPSVWKIMLCTSQLGSLQEWAS